MFLSLRETQWYDFGRRRGLAVLEGTRPRLRSDPSRGRSWGWFQHSAQPVITAARRQVYGSSSRKNGRRKGRPFRTTRKVPYQNV
jgi:hypothetical protein